MRLIYIFLMSGFLLSSQDARAGERIRGSGENPELACWNHDYRANEHARDKTTCYTSCKIDHLQFDGTTYSFESSAPNHRGSCKKSKYDRGYKGRAEFLVAYPRPGTPSLPSPAVTTSTAGQPVFGGANVLWQPKVPNSERARLTITNNTKEKTLTTYIVIVRDSRYSFPARPIDQGSVVLEPNTSWFREYHQWGGDGWHADWDF